MSDAWIPFLSALLGAVVGSLASVATTVIQSRAEQRREKARLVIQLALADHQATIDHAKEVVASGRVAKVFPLVSFIHYHTGVFGLLERGELTPETLGRLDAERHQITKYLEEQHPSRSARKTP